MTNAFRADVIAEQLRVDRFLLEYDDARSGTFEPLRFVPRGKRVVLGLLASTMEGNLITEADQWARLALVAETARAIWH